MAAKRRAPAEQGDDPRDRRPRRRLDRHRLARRQRPRRRLAARPASSCTRVIREHGYTTNRSARALSGGRTGLVGVTLPLVYPAYFAAILSGAAEALYEQDMRLVLSPTLHEHDREVSLLDRLMHGATDGALIVLPEESSDELEALQETRLPVRRRRPAHAARRAASRPSRPRTASGADAGDRAPALARAPPHRRDHRPARLGRDRRSARAATARRSRRPASCPTPSSSVEGNFEIASGGRGRRRCSTCPSRRPRSSRSTTTSRSACSRRRRARGLRVPGRPLDRRLRRRRAGDDRHPGADDGSPAARRDGPDGVSLLTRLLDHQRVEALHVELATRLVVRESTGPAPER